MNRRTGRLAVLAGVVAAVAATTKLVRGPRPVLTMPQQVRRRTPGPVDPGADDLTDRPVPRSVAALSTPPHFEQEPEPEPDDPR